MALRVVTTDDSDWELPEEMIGPLGVHFAAAGSAAGDIGAAVNRNMTGMQVIPAGADYNYTTLAFGSPNTYGFGHASADVVWDDTANTITVSQDGLYFVNASCGYDVQPDNETIGSFAVGDLSGAHEMLGPSLGFGDVKVAPGFNVAQIVFLLAGTALVVQVYNGGVELSANSASFRVVRVG